MIAEKNYPVMEGVGLHYMPEKPQDCKILVATPDLELQERLCVSLANMGLVVSQATKRDQAWHILKGHHPPQLALLAWEMAGLELMRYCVHGVSDLCGKPIHAALILPAEGSPETNQGLLSGASGFVHRPIEMAEVLALVETLAKLTHAENQNQWLSSKMLAKAEKDIVTGALAWEHFFSLSDMEFECSLSNAEPFAALMVGVNGIWDRSDGVYAPALDRAMRKVAKLILGHLGERDILGRIGRHEFAAALPHTGLAGARALAYKLRAAFSGLKIDYGQSSIELQANIGVAALDHRSVNMSTLLLRAGTDMDKRGLEI